MRYQNVRLAAFGHALPEERVTSQELEERLAPLYDRFRLRVGRLELMSGIRERRFFPPGTRPSQIAARAGAEALERSGVARERIGCLIHASVCRDFLEPATATVVHHELGLPDECTVFDLSNACLGVANAMILVADMIERGSIEAGIVVSGESGRPLVERTIHQLLANPDTNKDDLKRAFASLTIGSAGAAVVLERKSEDDDRRRFLGGSILSSTEHNVLCQGDQANHEDGGEGILMSTDAEALLLAGNALAKRTFTRFLEDMQWTRASIDRVVTHQVGVAHRRLLFETLELDPSIDFPTVETLGNAGSASLPLSFALAVEAGKIEPGHRVAMLGIGSGLNCLMLGVQW